MSNSNALTREELDWNDVLDGRFWEKVEKTETCWLWTRSTTRYGAFGVRGTIYRINRLAYVLQRGDIEAGQDVLHTCDNDKCVRPDHLFLGTQVDNMADMVSKSRAADKKGILNGRAVLTPEDALEIVALCREGEFSYAAIARFFGVTDVNVHGIMSGRLWWHTTGIPRKRVAA